MGWITIPSGNSSIETFGRTVKFYSIADDVGLIHDRLFDFMSAVSPGVIALVLVTVIFTIVILLFLSVRSAINSMSEM